MDKNFKVGDVVKVISNSDEADPEVGRIGVIKYVDDDNTILIAVDGFVGHHGIMGLYWSATENNLWWMADYELEVVATPKFQLGDRVEYIRTDRCMSDPEIGAVGTVSKIDDDPKGGVAYLVAFDGFNGHCGDWINGRNDLPEPNGWWVGGNSIKLSTISTVSTGSPIENLSKTYLDLINKVFHDVRLTQTERCKQIDSLIAVYNQKLRELEMSQRKFKVGDIIVGLSNNEYGITNSKAVMQVTKIFPEYKIEVTVLQHAGGDDFEANEYVGCKFDVEEEYFRKVIE